MSDVPTKWIRGYPSIANRIGLPVSMTRHLARAGMLPVVQLSERIIVASDERLGEYVAQMEARARGRT